MKKRRSFKDLSLILRIYYGDYHRLSFFQKWKGWLTKSGEQLIYEEVGRILHAIKNPHPILQKALYSKNPLLDLIPKQDSWSGNYIQCPITDANKNYDH